ncbi:hypothetical protein [Dokdonella soli]|uniref:Uncharacterized protein n=1 Tax=Dokdonella soli TaxID=529810 RepID=A0ABN1IU57_9GAMM
MRIHALKWAAAAVLLMIGISAHAQTWSSPIQLHNGDAYGGYTCAAPWEMLYMDDGYFPIYTPSNVYTINQIAVQRPHQPPPQLVPFQINMTPYGADLALWVCQSRSGNIVRGCVDVSDNYGIGVSEHVTVPAQWGWYYVIVTGNTGQQYPMCGQYFLTAVEGY